MNDLVRHLTKTDRESLMEMCRGLGIDPWKARRIGWLRAWVETAAIHGEAGRIELATGCSRSAALEQAAEACGVEFSTHHKRRVRARRDALDPKNEPEARRQRQEELRNSDRWSLTEEDAA